MTALERRGSGPPIVLMHGAAGNASWFKPLIDALPARHVIALDMPGHGHSADASSWEMEDLAELVFKHGLSGLEAPGDMRTFHLP